MRSVLACLALIAATGLTCVAGAQASATKPASSAGWGQDIEAALVAIDRIFRGETTTTIIKTVLAEGRLTTRQRFALGRFVPALRDLYNSHDFESKLTAGAVCAVITQEWLDQKLGGGALGTGVQQRSAQEWVDAIYMKGLRSIGLGSSHDFDLWTRSGRKTVAKFVTAAQMSRYSPATAVAYARTC